MLHLFPPRLIPEIMTSKGYAGYMAEMTDMSERTFRAPFIGPRSEAGIKRANENSHQYLLEMWVRRGYDEDEISTWLDGLISEENTFRLAESFVHGLRGPDRDFELPETVKLARRIDDISIDAIRAFSTGDVKAQKAHLLGDERLKTFNRPSLSFGNSAKPEHLCEIVDQAQDTTQLLQAWGVLSENALMALLAQLDAEYTGQYFRCTTPPPSFSFVTPQTSPKLTLPHKGRIRDWHRTPVRRLLDVVACMVYGFEHGHYPADVPTMEWLALRAFDPETTTTSPMRRLTRWRRGEVPLTLQDFGRLWDTVNASFEEEGTDLSVMAPLPMVFAALAWQKIYVRLGRKPEQSIRLIHEDYLAWWAESVKPEQSDLDLQPWPECFQQI